MLLLALIVFLLLTASCTGEKPICVASYKKASMSYSNKELLRDVKTLVFRKGEYTSYKRTYPIPSLKCVGYTDRCSKYHPSTISCTNVGWDGTDVIWECKAELSSEVRLGKTNVICEGHDYPDDPYITRGSCGLEYTLNLMSVFPTRTIVCLVIVLLLVWGLFIYVNRRQNTSRLRRNRPVHPDLPEGEVLTYKETPTTRESTTQQSSSHVYHSSLFEDVCLYSPSTPSYSTPSFENSPRTSTSFASTTRR
ncbi:hypothetical protein GEMRC1_007067 [Eukaryota sp. GEM-RC1]